ncbi:uncharacterized protein LOC121902335 [Thunnus maccoyii]|uniref:uncharacterized protein LOC121902335 n=1 Tax=Thunnus maccoyii TaxID=8240 RepID=UPI001C4BF329|nr:uncharacterized protein LOC121902335 [Thunnus maccoyii]
MDTTDDHCMEDVKKEREVDNDFSARLSDETHQHLSISEGPSSSCKRVRVKSRPKLLSTKSFPPYSQCIGGLGEDRDWDNELDSESHIDHQPYLRHEEAQGTERREDIELVPTCASDELRAKWRMRRKERLGGSYDIDAEGWARGRWSGKRRVEETAIERERDDQEREGEGKHWRRRNPNAETERNEEEDKERNSSVVSEIEGESEWSGETLGEHSEELMELPELREGSTSHQRSTPHPILSKLLQSSSSTSSCASINFSSAESDDVFTEGEDAGSKRKAFRKCRSWKTYLTMMHWSLRRQSSWVQLAGHQE